MERAPKPQPTPDEAPLEGTYERAPAAEPERIRVVHVSVQPKSWLGKAALAIAGLATLILALFFSILAFAVLIGVGVAAFAYFLLATRSARRAMREAARRERGGTG